MKKIRSYTPVFLIALLILFQSPLFSQGNIKGTVYNSEGIPLSGANIWINDGYMGSSSDSLGRFTLYNLPEGNYHISVAYLGYITERRSVKINARSLAIDFILDSDLPALEAIVVTGIFNRDTKLNSSVAISTLNAQQIGKRQARGTGDLLSAVPGNAIDMSAGEVGAQIYPRGLSTGAVADIGFKYSALQEDGLPIMSTQLQFAVIDMFHRADATVARLEAIRGGSASVSAANSPGGIFNFISRNGTEKFSGITQLSSGVQGDGNPYLRTDLNLGGPLAESGLFYNIGGFYRHDEGARNLPFPANKGGQLKGNLLMPYQNGSLKLYGKVLDDQVIFYKQLPVTSLKNPQPFPGFNLNNSTLIADVANEIPNAADPSTNRSYNARNGIQVNNYALGAQWLHELPNGWRLNSNIKYSYFDFDYNQSWGHNLLPIASAPNRIHRLSNEAFNSYSYRDAQTGELLAQYNNGELVGENHLGDKVLLTLAKTSTYQVNDFIGQFSLSRRFRNHNFTAGYYFGYSRIDNTLNLDFLLGRFEPNPRLLRLTHPNPYAGTAGQPSNLQFTDEKGYFAYGFGTFTNFSGNSLLQSFFLNDIWQVNSRLHLDLGLRYEYNRPDGKKEIWEMSAAQDPLSGMALGQDDDYSTFYDRYFKAGSGEFFNFDFRYDYWSGSLGLNYLLGKDLALYSRVTQGVKAPEMTYYINNFVNSDFQKGFEEEIFQLESGIKLNTPRLSMFLTGFYSRLTNIPFQILVVSGDIGQFTPVTFNTARTIGTEIEATFKPAANFSLDLIATIQAPRFLEFNYYNINRTGSDFSDDFIEEFDGNTINEVPAFSLDLTPAYRWGIFNAYLNWRYTGERYANRRNTLTLPAFSQFNGGLSGQISKRLLLSLNVNNLFNSAGLMNFEGVGIPGTTGEDITPAMIENVIAAQNRPYFVRPILPRSVILTLSSNF